MEFFTLPSGYLDVSEEVDLSYFRREGFYESVELGTTLKIPRNRERCRQLWKRVEETERSGSQSLPTPYLRRELRRGLIHGVCFRNFQAWIELHKTKQGGVSDDVMWDLLKKLGRNLKYIYSDMESPCCHNRLENGIAITPSKDRKGLDVFFFGADIPKTHVTSYATAAGKDLFYIKDAKAFVSILNEVKSSFNLAAQTQFGRWLNFLNKLISVKCVPDPDLQAKMLFNFPCIWTEEEALRFLANLSWLCKCKSANLLNSQSFVGSFSKGYAGWDKKIAAHMGLNSMFKFNQGNYMRPNPTNPMGQPIADEPSIINFSHNAVKHYSEGALAYNTSRPVGDPTINVGLNSSEVLAFQRDFRYILQDGYKGVYSAFAAGYVHPRYNINFILSGRI